MSSTRRRVVGLALLLAAAGAAWQRTPLPHGTGSLAASAGWTVLGRAEIEASERATDPKTEPARAILQVMVAEFRSRGRAGDHVVLHSPGATPGSLRLVNCYSAEVRATTAQLLREDTVAELKQNYAAQLAQGGAEAAFRDHGDPRLFPTGSLRLRYELRGAEHRVGFQLHAVPAGERVQYFEVVLLAGDVGEPAVDELLRTFDGAQEPGSISVPRIMLACISGGIGGLAVFLLRRFWQRRSATVPPRAAAR